MKRQNSETQASKQIKNPNGFCKNLDLCPGEKVMHIYLIRRKIFREFSRAKELLIFRQVCKTWEAEATSALLQPKFERALQISFRYSAPTSAFISDTRKNTRGERSLGDFMEDRKLARKRLVENIDFENGLTKQNKQNLNFLDDCCTFFKFQGGDLGRDPDSVRFFMDPKSRVKSLTVDLYNKKKNGEKQERGVTLESFRNILLRWGNSIKYLNLVTVSNGWRWSDSLFSGPRDSENADPAPPILLPKELQDSDFLTKFDLRLWSRTPEADQHLRTSFPALEILKLSHSPFDHCPRVVNDLLRGAPNLKETFYHNEGDFVDVLETENKLHTLKSWFFAPRRYEKHVSSILEVKNRNPIQLLKFGILKEAIEIHPGAAEMLSQVLKESQGSLEVVYDPLALIELESSGLIIPQGPFNKVRKVRQSQPVSTLGKVDMTETFPNVKHFKIRYCHVPPFTKRDLEVINNLDLCLTSPLTSVTTLEFLFNHADVSVLNEESFRTIQRLFPNSVNFLVSTSRIPKKLPQLLHSLFKYFPHSRAISFKFRYRHKEDHYSWDQVNEDFLQDDSWVQRMDAAITGTKNKNENQQIYQKNSPYFDDEENEGEKARKGLIQSVSILDMKDLQYFGMDFGLLFPPPRVFSQTAFDCGFHILKNQRVLQDFQLEFQPQFLP